MKIETVQTIVVALVFGFLAGYLSTYFHPQSDPDSSSEQLLADWYEAESLIHVSPHHLRKAMASGDTSFVLVDLRSAEEYEEEHIVGAINVPAYRDRDHSDYGAVERIVSSFKDLREQNLDKDLIVYCYSIPCMTGRKVGNILTEYGIYVQQLGVGWNEWRYHWTLWNHAHEWEQTNVQDYVSSGATPGSVPENLPPGSCEIEGELSC